jgi:hypothetical protein
MKTLPHSKARCIQIQTMPFPPFAIIRCFEERRATIEIAAIAIEKS